MLQEQLERLRQTDEFPGVHDEGSYFLSAIVDDSTHVVLGVTRDRGRGGVGGGFESRS